MALILIPICVHWFIVNVGFFEGDEILCRFAAFLDFFLAAEYPILLITLSIILYSRKYPKLEDRIYGLQLDELEPEEMDPMALRYGSQTPSIRAQSQMQSAIKNPYRASPPNSNNPYRESPPIYNPQRLSQPVKPASVAGGSVSAHGRPRVPSALGDASRGRRAPSVAGSDTGYRPGSRGFQPQRPVMLNNDSAVANAPRKPGSVTTSIEGRLASGRRVSQLQQQQRFLTSSPLQEEEEGSADLWDAVSLDYPGKQSPEDWGFLSDDDPHNYEEPRFHTWHYWLLAFSWGLAMAIGIPASMFVEYQPLINMGSDRSRTPRKGRPGCYIPADPFKNPYSHTVDDPGFNFTLSNLVIAYILPSILLVFLIFMIYCRKLTDNQKFRRYVKLLTMLTLVFFISRSPMDILQLKGIVEAAMGFKQLNLLPYQLEYEILLVWATYIPLLAHPIIYFCFCSEYRQGGWKGFRSLCGCPIPTEEEKIDKYNKDIDVLSSRSSASRTQKSNML